jgi:hypothetical protein
MGRSTVMSIRRIINMTAVDGDRTLARSTVPTIVYQKTAVLTPPKRTMSTASRKTDAESAVVTTHSAE